MATENNLSQNQTSLSAEHMESIFHSNPTDNNPAPPNSTQDLTQDNNFHFKGFWRLFGQAWIKLFSHFWSFIGLNLYSLVPLLVGGLILALASVIGVSFQAGGKSSIGTGVSLVLGVVIFAFSFIWFIRIYFANFIMAYKLLGDNEKLSVSQSLAQTKPLVGKMLWTAILTGLIVLAGFLLFGIPGLIFASWFSIILFLPVAEGVGGVKAVGRIYEIIKGYGWEMYSLLLSQGFIQFIISFGLSLVVSFGGMSVFFLGPIAIILFGLLLVFAFIINLLFIPITVLIPAGRFVDLKKIKDSNLPKTNSTATAVITAIILSAIILPAMVYSILKGPDSKKSNLVPEPPFKSQRNLDLEQKINQPSFPDLKTN